MNIADLGTLLRIYDDLTFGARKHLVGHLLTCTPDSVKILQTLHKNDPYMKEFLTKMHELGIHPPTFMGTPKLPEAAE